MPASRAHNSIHDALDGLLIAGAARTSSFHVGFAIEFANPRCPTG